MTAKASHEISLRDGRVAAFHTIGCALATLRRLDHVWFDAELRSRITEARRTLSVTQSVLKDKIDATAYTPNAERKSR